MIFYKELLRSDGFSSAEKVIYSFLLYKAISNIDEVFDSEGSFDVDILKDTFDFNEEVWEYAWNLSVRKIAKETNISEKQVQRCLTELKNNDLVVLEDKQYLVHIHKDIVLNGYFHIDTESGKLSSIRIFYFYLKHKAEKYGGSIDTWYYKLAEEFSTTENNIKMMISRLKKEGLVDRIGNKLKIN